MRFQPKRRSWVEIGVKVIFAIVTILIAVQIIGIGWLAYEAAKAAGSADWSGGLRGVVEVIWCGAKGCLQ